MSRSYRPSAEAVLAGRQSFTRSSHASPKAGAPPFRSLPYCACEGRDSAPKSMRCWRCLLQKSGAASDSQARVFARVLWLLTLLAPNVALYTDILPRSVIQERSRCLTSAPDSTRPDGAVAAAIRPTYRIGSTRNLTFERLDRFDYDFDILACVDQLATARQPKPAFETPASVDGRVRLAYLLRGVTELNSVLMKHAHGFAELHDRSRFEVAFFVPEQSRQVAASPQGVKHLQRLKPWLVHFVAPTVKTGEASSPSRIDRGSASALAGDVRCAVFRHSSLPRPRRPWSLDRQGPLAAVAPPH